VELPEVRNPRLRAYALRAAINAPIQGFEADLMRLAMVKIADAIKSDYKSSSGGEPQSENEAKRDAHPDMIMQVHDEIVFECDAAGAERFAAEVKSLMENVTSLSVPLLAETTISAEWGK
jgi:DNA polymerase-1